MDVLYDLIMKPFMVVAGVKMSGIKGGFRIQSDFRKLRFESLYISKIRKFISNKVSELKKLRTLEDPN